MRACASAASPAARSRRNCRSASTAIQAAHADALLAAGTWLGAKTLVGIDPKTLQIVVGATVILFSVMAAFQARMLASDGQLFNFRQNWKGFRFLFGMKGLFADLVPKYFDFFRPGFHPNDHDTTALLNEWRTILFAPGGELYDQLKNKSAATRH